MTRSDLITAWAREVGLDPKAIQGHLNLCAFSALERYEVTLEWPDGSDDVFVLIDIIDSHGGELRRKRLARAMQLNAFGLATRGATLGWDEVSDRISLSYRVAGDAVDVTGLNNIVINLVEVAQSVHEALRFERDEAQVAQIAHTANWFQPLSV